MFELPTADASAPKDENQPQTANPELSLTPEKAAEVKGENQCKVGDSYSASVTLKVKSVGDDGSISFEVPTITDFAPAGAVEEPESEDSGLLPPDLAKGRPTILSGIGKSLQS